MHFPKRAARTLACLLTLISLTTAPVAGLSAAPADPVPWLYRGSDVPPDRQWVFGELPNGLRYAVRKNGVPPGQVAIRIRVDAGSLNERDDERGYAHLIEHMLFRQSKYLGNGEAIPAFQRLGAGLGPDTNAETSQTQTVYHLDLPNATPASLDEAFKLLSGMVTAPALNAQGLALDVPIVLAEMRERGGVAERVQDKMRETFYEGQLLADRSTIGTVDSLHAATPASVRGFYQRWYRPENVVVIVAGDADTATLAAEVQKWFGEWKGVGPHVAAPNFGAPKPPPGSDPKNPVGAAEVMVEPQLPRAVTYAIVRPWHQVHDTIVYNQGLMLDQLAQAIINRRLESKARRGGTFLSAQVNQDRVSRSADVTFVSFTPLGPDWRSALTEVRGVIADALENPPTQAEIDREVAETDVAFQVPVEQSSLLAGSKVADDLVNALDIRETVASPETVLSIFRQSKPLFTTANILAHTRSLFTGTVTRALVVTPKPGEATSAEVRTALLAPAKPDAGVRVAGPAVRFEDLPPVGEPGRILSDTPTGLLGIEQVDFANGVKAMLWPVSDEPGRVQVKVRFGAGYRAFGPNDAPYAALGPIALVSSGEGKLGEEELDRISTGRKLAFNLDIDDASFSFSAETRQADLADQLYLFAAKFAMPRWDPNPVLRAKAAAALQYEGASSSPQGVLDRDLKYYQRDRDPRFRAATPTDLGAATPEGFKDVWSRALADGPIEVQIFGDFDRTATIAALTKTFGALPTRPPLPANLAPASPKFPAANAEPVVLTHHGDANQAAAIVSWPTGGGSAGISESRQLEILAQLFTNRLMDAMREKYGASYSPQVVSSWPVDLDSGGSMTAIAQLEPGAVPVFFRTATEIAADLAKAPPSADELARVVEPMRQQINRAATSSAFFMYQLEGATNDPRRIAAVRTILSDYTQITPQQIQALAAKYLVADKAWKLAVMPEQAKDKAVTAAR
jgi:zinc protease